MTSEQECLDNDAGSLVDVDQFGYDHTELNDSNELSNEDYVYVD